jgi:hypothetical protein
MKKALGVLLQVVLILAVLGNVYLCKQLLDQVRIHDQKLASIEERLSPMSRDLLAVTGQANDMLEKMKAMGAYKMAASDEEKLDPDLWKNPLNWKRLRMGLTDDDVLGILGRPTSRQFVTETSEAFFYEGMSKDYGDLTSKVILEGGRVKSFEAPTFRPKR